MATTPIELVYKPGKTLTVDIYPEGSDTADVTARSLTEETNRDGYYECNVTEALDGYYTVHVYEGSVLRETLDIVLVDSTATCYCTVKGTNVIHRLVAETGVVIADDAIKASTFDESTAFPLTSADSGATAVMRTGADGDTGATLSGQMDSLGGGIGATQTQITTAFTEIKGATWSSYTDTLEALRNRGDAAWTTATGFSTFNPATDTVDVGKINGSATAAVNLQYLNDAVLPLTVDDATFTPTATVFETDGTITADDTLIGMAGTWFNSSGTPANEGTYFISSSEGTTTNTNNKLKITTETMPAAPADGDIFVVLGSKVR